MLGKRCILLLLGLWCTALLSCRGHADVVSVFDDPDVDAWVASAAVPSAVITQDDLPTTRPPFPTSQGYKFCNYNCARNITILAGSQTPGVFYLDVSYKPITNVTSTMMVWMFKNLAGKAKYYVDGKEYPMYLIFHPRDHYFHLAENKIPGRVAVGTNFTWCEMMLTNCRYSKSSATAPWFCPSKAQGYFNSTPEADYSTKMQTKEVMTVTQLNNSGIQFVKQYPLLGRTVATTRHTWRNSAKGLLLRTEFWLGRMKAGSNTEFDPDSSLTPAIASVYTGGATNVQSPANATQLAWMNALHFLEEYGGLKTWLPQVYAGRVRR